jgi:hypothetical protein
VGYSKYDSRELPRTVFLLLSALDGRKTWQAALAEANQGGFDLSADGFIDLYRAGLVGPDQTSPALERMGTTVSLPGWRSRRVGCGQPALAFHRVGVAQDHLSRGSTPPAQGSPPDHEGDAGQTRPRQTSSTKPSA